MADADLTSLGKYDIVRPLGRGAMGVVYEGFDPIIARRVAIKTVRLDRLDEPEAAEDLLRFKREAQAAGRLTHPNIVGVYDYGETDTLAYIVMEFVEGDTLKTLLDRGERFTPADAVGMMEALLAGLAYSHEHGVIHRDIKPANVMITRDGRLKLADFGVARIESSSLTQAGTMIGTPSYMSPEQFMGQTIDARTDIYSAGVLLYQLLTGEKPFEGSVTAIMHKVLNVEPPAPSALSVSVSPALDGVTRQAMAKRPEERFATARDFAAALRTTETPIDSDATMIAAAPAPANGAPVRIASPPPTPRRSKIPLIAGAGIVLLAGLAGAFLLIGRPHPHVARQPAKAASVPIAQPPAVPPPPRLADLRTRLTAALAPIDCTLLHARLDHENASLTGLANKSTSSTIVPTAAHAIAPLMLNSMVQSFTGPYCGMIDAIRPFDPLFATPADRIQLRLAKGATRLVKNQHIIVHITMPAFAGYLTVDYVSSSGAIYRLYPAAALPGARHQPGSTITLGTPPGPQFAVGAPYGQDMILAIASTQPLTGLPKSQASTVASFNPALRASLTNLKTQNARTSTTAILVTTLRSG